MKFPHPLYILLFTATATFAVNGFLVYKAVSEKRDLVARNYYQESLQYNEWRSQRENARDKGLAFSLEQVGSQWRVSIKQEAPLSAEDASADKTPATVLEDSATPSEDASRIGKFHGPTAFQNASLNFYRPGDQNLDHKISLHREGQNLVAEYRPLAPGAWRVTLSLQLENTRLAQDFELML